MSAAPDLGATGLVPPARRVRVLFVDDDPQLLEAVEDLLYRSYDVVTATRASAGLAMLERDPIPIVVSDLRLPEMDGISFLGEVRARAPATVRMLTGHADLDAAVRAVNHGAIFRLLIKPCPPDELHTALRDAVEQRRIMHADRDLLAARVEELSSTLVRSERLATLGTMTAAVSHEMRNALTILGSSIAEIRELVDGHAVPDAELVEMLEAGQARLSRHVAGVLGLAPTPGRPRAARSMSAPSPARSSSCCAMSASRAGSRSASRSTATPRRSSAIAASSSRC